MTPAQLEDRLSEALGVLTSTDEEAAQLKMEAEQAEARYQATVDAHFLSETGNNEERKAKARHEAEPLYIDFLSAQRKYDALSNRRKSESIVCDAVRSMMANLRQGT